MKIDDSLMAELENMAALSLSCDERERAKRDICDMVDYFDVLKELVIVREEQSKDGAQSLREDIPSSNFNIGETVGDGIYGKDGFFKVPNIMGGETDDADM